MSVDRFMTLTGKANEAVRSAIEDVYAEAGIYVVYSIRSGLMSNWDNDTGNLRSSIGWAVCRKGRIVRRSRFGVVLNGSEGAAKGAAMVEKLASEYARYDFALFIVAGEEYAVYVEAVDNKVVLAGGQLYIEKNITRRLRERISQALRNL